MRPRHHSGHVWILLPPCSWSFGLLERDKTFISHPTGSSTSHPLYALPKGKRVLNGWTPGKIWRPYVEDQDASMTATRNSQPEEW
ncbi:hypothetical protein K474DRAFT_1709554 [Panus rudis PR-1116 ss-1]|nr:hypothetical protein K474DRAFT_1709554 [Panus rudis PR-1116 ss-1]